MISSFQKVSNPPHDLTEEQVQDAIAWAWINHPDLNYKGLQQAFNLLPSKGEIN